MAMSVLYTRCAGLDVHKETVVACLMLTASSGKITREVRTFATTTLGLQTMAQWLASQQVTHIAMESTGIYWRPVFNILEGRFEVILVNAQHMKAVPGHKTDVKDSEWLADLLRHGLLSASFIPPKPIRDLRDLVRHRKTLVRQRAQAINRVQKVLETANIKLSSVASDVLGKSGRDMLDATLASQAPGVTRGPEWSRRGHPSPPAASTARRHRFPARPDRRDLDRHRRLAAAAQAAVEPPDADSRQRPSGGSGHPCGDGHRHDLLSLRQAFGLVGGSGSRQQAEWRETPQGAHQQGQYPPASRAR